MHHIAAKAGMTIRCNVVRSLHPDFVSSLASALVIASASKARLPTISCRAACWPHRCLLSGWRARYHGDAPRGHHGGDRLAPSANPLPGRARPFAEKHQRDGSTQQVKRDSAELHRNDIRLPPHFYFSPLSVQLRTPRLPLRSPRRVRSISVQFADELSLRRCGLLDAA